MWYSSKQSEVRAPFKIGFLAASAANFSKKHTKIFSLNFQFYPKISRNEAKSNEDEDKQFRHLMQ